MQEAPANSVHPLTRAEWRAWLERHHTRTEGVWLISFKRSLGRPRVEYEEAVEEALCFGWIDGRMGKLDEQRSMQWFSPRRPRSTWSRSNRERVERLIAAGLMTPAGLAKIEAAKQSGAWNALEPAEALEMPPDLEAALASRESARERFERYPRSTRRGLLGWIASAKKPETRAQRVQEVARLAKEGVRLTEPPRA